MPLKPEDWTFADEIISEIFEGSTLQNALTKRGTSRTKFFRIVDEDVKLQLAYARAQESRSHIMADEVVTIADDQNEDPNRARNRMQARQWAAAKINPGKYSDRLEVSVIAKASIVDALAEAESRPLPMRYLPNVVDAEVIESTNVSPTQPTGSKPVDADVVASSSPTDADDIFK